MTIGPVGGNISHRWSPCDRCYPGDHIDGPHIMRGAEIGDPAVHWRAQYGSAPLDLADLDPPACGVTGTPQGGVVADSRVGRATDLDRWWTVERLWAHVPPDPRRPAHRTLRIVRDI